jgi:hypothetical protein
MGMGSSQFFPTGKQAAAALQRVPTSVPGGELVPQVGWIQAAGEELTRAELIADLTERVDVHRATGLTLRKAIRAVAEETGLSTLRTKRLVDVYPEA